MDVPKVTATNKYWGGKGTYTLKSNTSYNHSLLWSTIVKTRAAESGDLRFQFQFGLFLKRRGQIA